ncbi:MAG: hypothetical protein MH213_07490 [Marinobacter sp.]|nr:hypothetical protein [Marinobacter sp.]
MDVPLSWQLAKLVISIGIVLGLSLVAERVSARMAGMLAGYPLGTAIALYFIGLEISPAFATESAVHTLAGFSATLALSGGYLLGARRDGLAGVLSGTALGILAWLLTSLVLTSIDFNRITGTLTTFVAILIFVRLYRRVPDVAVGARRSLSWPALALRSGLAAGIIL